MLSFPVIPQGAQAETWTSFSYIHCLSIKQCQKTMPTKHLKYTYCPIFSLHFRCQHSGSSPHLSLLDYKNSLLVGLPASALSFIVQFSPVAREILIEQLLEMF